MKHAMLDELRDRAFLEIDRRDDEGAILHLNYRENQIFKGGDYREMRHILDRHLARDNRNMIWIGVLIPAALLVEYHIWSGSPVLIALITLLAMVGAGYAVKVCLSRIGALERARLLLELCDELSSEPVT